MYSSDRREAFEHMVSFLEDMPLYNNCQKTIVADEESNISLPGWGLIKIPRIDGKFCWANMWNAGVLTAEHEKVIYLDSDRLLPRNFLQQCVKEIRDDLFVYTSHHFIMLEKKPLDWSKEVVALLSEGADIFLNEDIIGTIKFDPRFGEPVHGPGKNVMSGCTGFTKKTYFRLGGVDPWYCGHGAYADTDFHFQAATYGCDFVDLKMPELHYPHEKKTQDALLSKDELAVLGLDNFIYYCHKWQLPLTLAEDLSQYLGVESSYVSEKIKEYAKGFVEKD